MFLKTSRSTIDKNIIYDEKFERTAMRYQEILETQEKHKANALKFASTHEDGGAYWADIPTRISGCERIFWVPLSRKYPYFLVEPTTGRVFSPSENCKVVECNSIMIELNKQPMHLE